MIPRISSDFLESRVLSESVDKLKEIFYDGNTRIQDKHSQWPHSERVDPYRMHESKMSAEQTPSSGNISAPVFSSITSSVKDIVNTIPDAGYRELSLCFPKKRVITLIPWLRILFVIAIISSRPHSSTEAITSDQGSRCPHIPPVINTILVFQISQVFCGNTIPSSFVQRSWGWCYLRFQSSVTFRRPHNQRNET